MEFTRNELVEIGFEERRFCIFYGLLVLINIAFLFLDIQQAGIMIRLAIVIVASLLKAFVTYKFAKALKKNKALCIVSSIFVMVPFIGIILVLVFSGEATRLMKQAGLPVGLLGVPKKRLLEFATAEDELSIQDNATSRPYVIPEDSERKKQRKTELCIIASCFALLGAIFYMAWGLYSHELGKEAPFFGNRNESVAIQDVKNTLRKSKRIKEEDFLNKSFSELFKNSKAVTFSSDLGNTRDEAAFDANACSKEAIGKEVLPYLWCTMGMCRGAEERVIKDGRFSVRLIYYWQKEPTITQGPSWCTRYRFMNEDKTKNKQWISIEHMAPPPNMSTDGDIATWVEMPRMITGKPLLDIPEKQDFTVLKFNRIRQTDEIFMKKHGLKQMASYAGTIKIGETVCCVYIALMQKGRESWKMEVVFPASYKEGPVKEGEKVFSPVVNNDEELSNVAIHPFNMRTAGLFMGHFKILE